MAKTTDPKTIVLIDDEIHQMSWMVDYLEDKGFAVKTADNLNDGLNIVNKQIFRELIIDLSIPILPPLDHDVNEKGRLYAQYPGLYLAYSARNMGYRIRQVVIYSVHSDPSVAEEAKLLGCTYILKGRPREIKKEIDRVVDFDPTS